MTQVFFEDMKTQVLQQLNQAQYQIYACLIQLNEPELCNKLIEKAQQGCLIKLIFWNRNNTLISQDFLDKSSEYQIQIRSYACPDNQIPVQFLQNNLCLIDQNTLLQGSYPWSKENTQSPNFLILSQNPKQALQYQELFFEQWHKIQIPNKPENNTALIPATTTNLPTTTDNTTNQNVTLSDNIISVETTEEEAPTTKPLGPEPFPESEPLTLDHLLGRADTEGKIFFTNQRPYIMNANWGTNFYFITVFIFNCRVKLALSHSAYVNLVSTNPLITAAYNEKKMNPSLFAKFYPLARLNNTVFVKEVNNSWELISEQNGATFQSVYICPSRKKEVLTYFGI